MTASISRYSPSTSEFSHRLWHALRGMLLAVLCALAMPAQAEGIEAQYVEIVPLDDEFVLNAAFTIQSNARLEELVSRGVALPFIAEFSLKSGRWYWWDDVVVERTQELRLSYHALTRQYRINSGGLSRSFPSLDEALRAMLTLRGWQVTPRSRLVVGNSYKAALRVKLDLTLLPKPFQIAAIGDRDLDLASNWQRWTFLVVAPDSAP